MVGDERAHTGPWKMLLFQRSDKGVHESHAHQLTQGPQSMYSAGSARICILTARVHRMQCYMSTCAVYRPNNAGKYGCMCA